MANTLTDSDSTREAPGFARHFDSPALLGRPWSHWVTLLARLLLGGTLLVAGVIKAVNLEGNVLSVRAYQLFDLTWQRIIGYSLPVIEIIVGLLIITGLFTRLSGLLGSLMMVAFIAGMTSAWARGLSLDCGCFGTGGEVPEGEAHYGMAIARDIGLLACGLWMVWRPKSLLAVDNWLFGPIMSTTSLGSDRDEDYHTDMRNDEQEHSVQL